MYIGISDERELMLISKLQEHLRYVQNTGELFLITPKGTRQIFPNENNVQFTIDKTKVKLKYTNLIWCLVYGIKPSATEKVFHKDLDESNYKLNNLVLISTELYFQLKEAIDNLQFNLKLYNHPKDSYVYVLEYKCNGRIKKENISDLNIARKKKLKLQLKLMKFISAYVVSQ